MENREGESSAYENWHAVMEDLLYGNPERQHLAAVKLNHLISAFLRRFNARHYRNDFEDLRQTVVFKLVLRFRRPPLPAPEAFVNYAKRTTWNEFLTLVGDPPPDIAYPSEDNVEPPSPHDTIDLPTRLALQTCLEHLPPDLREAVFARYFQDLKLVQAAAEAKKALATFKRHLREAFNLLRSCLDDHLSVTDISRKE